MRKFTEEQHMFRDAYRRFLADEVAPHMPKFREEGIVDREIFKKAGDQGFLMVWPDEKYGGLGDWDFRYEQIIIEEAARAGCHEWYATLHSRLVGPYFRNFGNGEYNGKFDHNKPNNHARDRQRVGHYRMETRDRGDPADGC